MLTFRERIYQVTDGLERFLPHYELAVMKQPAGLKGVDKALAALEAAQQALVTLLVPTPGKALTTAERITSLIAALTALAHVKRVALLKLDALHSLLIAHFRADVAGYWANRAGEIQGWICDPKPTSVIDDGGAGTGLLQRTVSERISLVAEELRSRGVLVWYYEPDRHFRLIDTNWLEAHADIRAHVAKEWEGGRRCRFCEMTEIATSPQLVAVDPAKRSVLPTLNGAVVLQTGTIYAHERCIPHWERWRTIAESYKTQEEAAEADRVAGRQSRVPPDVTSESERPAITDTTEHFNATEQYR